MTFTDIDPFELPDWLGDGEVTWAADGGLRGGHHVPGTLRGSDQELPCDLLAVDEAYPAPVADDAARHRTHQAWRHGQVHLVSYEHRLTLLAPGREFGPEEVLEVLGRLAKAVGAPPSRYAVLLRLSG